MLNLLPPPYVTLARFLVTWSIQIMTVIVGVVGSLVLLWAFILGIRSR
jgi:hypothetical protein